MLASLAASIVLLLAGLLSNSAGSQPSVSGPGAGAPLAGTPNWIGKSYSDAAGHFPLLAKTYHKPSDCLVYTPVAGRPDVVVWQDPLPTSSGSPPAGVKLYVSTQVVVPDFSGMTAAAALRVSGERGLALENASTGDPLISSSSLIDKNEDLALIGNFKNVGSTVGVYLIAAPEPGPTSCLPKILIAAAAGLGAGFVLTKLSMAGKKTMHGTPA